MWRQYQNITETQIHFCSLSCKLNSACITELQNSTLIDLNNCLNQFDEHKLQEEVFCYIPS